MWFTEHYAMPSPRIFLAEKFPIKLFKYLQLYFLFFYFREDPSCVNTVTFCQFLFIAVEGFIFTANFGYKKPVIPIRYNKSVILSHVQTHTCAYVPKNLQQFSKQKRFGSLKTSQLPWCIFCTDNYKDVNFINLNL